MSSRLPTMVRSKQLIRFSKLCNESGDNGGMNRFRAAGRFTERLGESTGRRLRVGRPTLQAEVDSHRQIGSTVKGRFANSLIPNVV